MKLTHSAGIELSYQEIIGLIDILRIQDIIVRTKNEVHIWKEGGTVWHDQKKSFSSHI